MKKYLATIACLAALSSIMLSCGKTSTTTTTVNDNTVAEDSARLAAEENAKQEAAWKEDSAKIVNKVTYDLSFNEVHGPVHTLTTDGQTYTYNESGNIILLDGYNPFTSNVYEDFNSPKTRFTRDKGGRIVKFESWESGSNYIWKNHRISKIEWQAEGYWGEITFIYDKQGLCTTRKSKEGDISDEVTYTTEKITYTKFDEYGNWTERKINGKAEKRSITYYPLHRPSNTSGAFNPQKQSYTFVGTIGGESNRSLEIGPDGGQYIVNSGARDVKFNTYDEATGALVIDAYVSGNFIGNFDGTFNPSTGEYSGTFTNTKGGSVKFSMKLI